jgi:hypothetical protein
MTPLQNQSVKAQKIVTTICLTNGCGHKHVTACRSLTSPELNYQQTIIPTGKEVIDGHKVIIYSVKCELILEIGLLVQCKGNGHCHTLCKHSLNGIRTVVKAQGKTLRTAKTWRNALKSKGTLVKLVGESGFYYGVIGND